MWDASGSPSTLIPAIKNSIKSNLTSFPIRKFRLSMTSEKGASELHFMHIAPSAFPLFHFCPLVWRHFLFHAVWPRPKSATTEMSTSGQAHISKGPFHSPVRSTQANVPYLPTCKYLAGLMIKTTNDRPHCRSFAFNRSMPQSYTISLSQGGHIA